MVTRLPLAVLMLAIFVIAAIVIGYVISLIIHAGRTAPVVTRRCANCQKRLPIEARFCSRCGHQLTAANTGVADKPA